MTTLPRRLACGAATVALSLGALTACSSGGGVSDNSDADSDGDGTASPEEVLALAKQTFDDASGVSISASTDDLPDGVTGVEKAEGTGTHAPAFEGTITVNLSGLSVDVPVTAVDGKVYAKIPPLQNYQDVNPNEYGAPDPAGLMDPDTGFSTALTATEDVEEGDTVRGGSDNTEVLTEYTGTVPASAVTSLVPSASGDFDATYTIAENGELREAVLTGSFYPKVDSMTYTIDLDDYGTDKDITKPSGG